MPLPLIVSCFCKIQIGVAFLVPAHPGSPGKRAVKRVCVCVHSCFSKTVTRQTVYHQHHHTVYWHSYKYSTKYNNCTDDRTTDHLDAFAFCWSSFFFLNGMLSVEFYTHTHTRYLSQRHSQVKLVTKKLLKTSSKSTAMFPKHQKKISWIFLITKYLIIFSLHVASQFTYQILIKWTVLNRLRQRTDTDIS